MKNSILTAIYLLAFTIANAQKNVEVEKRAADSVKHYLNEALGLMKQRSVNRGKLNWTSIYKTANLEVQKATTIAETYPIIKRALSKLEDSHSKFFSPNQVAAYQLGYRKTGQQFPEIRSAILPGNYAYLQLPAFASLNAKEWDEYVTVFWSKILELEAKHPKGWILDIRDNEGGMFAPMYAAISPFLNRHHVVGWRDGQGKDNFISFRNGILYEHQLPKHQFKSEHKKVTVKRKPLVVLINQGTASSGEFAAIAFVGQRNVSFVGTKTAGLTSSNQEHRLSDGAFLVLTEGNTIDRNKKEYAEVGQGLAPDYAPSIMEGQDKRDAYLEKAIEVINVKSGAL